jgi:transposase
VSGRPNAFTEQQITRMVHLYEEMKLSVERIAERFETNCMSVWRALKRSGVEIRPNSRNSKLDMDTVIKMYRSGISSNQIGEQFGLKGESIRYRLRKAGVNIRSKSDAAKTYMAADSEWTPERLEKFRELWDAGVTAAEIKRQLGVSYGEASIPKKARALGFPPRRQAKSHSEISTLASAVAAARQYRDDTIISFLPDSPQLEADWRSIINQVRMERAAAAEAARV